MAKLGFMQGRLSPMVDGKIQAFPWTHWQNEFALAQKNGLRCMDWIVETEGLKDNPMMNPEGRKKIRSLSEASGIEVVSICADYFMENPALRCSLEELKVFDALLDAAHHLGISFIEIPCVDHSAIQSPDEMKHLADRMQPYFHLAQQAGVTFAFETSLNPADFRMFLDLCAHDHARANYDSGNSSALGYDVKEEFAQYGSDVVTVHIKDRVRGGTTVPLGEGDVVFKDFFHALKEAAYDGPLILQVARGEDDIEVIRESLNFIQPFLKQG